MPKRPLKMPAPAETTIAGVLDQFLAERQARLKPKTYAQYESIIDLFKHHLDGYAYENLSKPESALFDRHYNATGKDHREFCQIFGPEKIIDGFGMFLSYFMVRKVMAGADLKRAAGTVTKKLAKWLAAKGYASESDAEIGAERGADAASELPKAERASEIMYEAEYSIDGDPDDLPEKDYLDVDHYSISRLAPGKLWFDVYDGGSPRVVGPVAVPKAATDLLAEGWDVSCALVRVRGKWHMTEVGNVYPM